MGHDPARIPEHLVLRALGLCGREAQHTGCCSRHLWLPPPVEGAGPPLQRNASPHMLPALTTFVLCWRDTVGIYKNNTVYLQTLVHACFVEHKAPTPEIISIL